MFHRVRVLEPAITFLSQLKLTVMLSMYKAIQRNYYRGNYIAAREELSQVSWTEMDGMDVHDNWDFFLNKLTDCIEKTCTYCKKCR